MSSIGGRKVREDTEAEKGSTRMYVWRSREDKEPASLWVLRWRDVKDRWAQYADIWDPRSHRMRKHHSLPHQPSALGLLRISQRLVPMTLPWWSPPSPLKTMPGSGELSRLDLLQGRTLCQGCKAGWTALKSSRVHSKRLTVPISKRLVVPRSQKATFFWLISGCTFGKLFKNLRELWRKSEPMLCSLLPKAI